MIALRFRGPISVDLSLFTRFLILSFFSMGLEQVWAARLDCLAIYTATREVKQNVSLLIPVLSDLCWPQILFWQQQTTAGCCCTTAAVRWAQTTTLGCTIQYYPLLHLPFTRWLEEGGRADKCSPEEDEGQWSPIWRWHIESRVVDFEAHSETVSFRDPIN